MTDPLEPEVTGFCFDEGFSPALPVMYLRWHSDVFCQARRWLLPTGVTVVGPAPERFGVTIHRVTNNEYQISLVWDTLCLRWPGISRAMIANTSLPLFLAAMGTDLDYLLDQPPAAVEVEPRINARHAA